jgi:hypothetical protein
MSIICGACGHENKDEMRFCGECGGKIEAAPVTFTCLACGHVNKLGVKFCGECGMSPENASAQRAKIKVTLDKTEYDPGEDVAVSVSGITASMENSRAFVSVYCVGASHSEYGVYKHLAAGDSVETLAAPLDSGDFEIRLYTHGNVYDDSTFVTSLKFTVIEEQKAGETTVSLNKESYLPGEEISISVSNVTRKMVGMRAFVAIYRAGAAHSEYGNYGYPQFGDTQLPLSAPEEIGDYEVRMYSRDGQYDDTTFIVSVKFKVTGLICSACGHENTAGTKFCNECGGTLAPKGKCSACGHENSEGMKFCGSCGNKL